jgi:hypothetical protein
VYLLVAVQVRRFGGGSQPPDGYTFDYECGVAEHLLGTGIFVCKGLILAFRVIKCIQDMEVEKHKFVPLLN